MMSRPKRVFKFPGGLADHLAEQIGARECVTAQPFAGMQEFPQADGTGQGRAEWAIAWPLYSDGSTSWYCNTVPHTGRRHPRTGLAHGADPRASRLLANWSARRRPKDITAMM